LLHFALHRRIAHGEAERGDGVRVRREVADGFAEFAIDGQRVDLGFSRIFRAPSDGFPAVENSRRAEPIISPRPEKQSDPSPFRFPTPENEFPTRGNKNPTPGKPF
jgi:hypothetical protein